MCKESFRDKEIIWLKNKLKDLEARIEDLEKAEVSI